MRQQARKGNQIVVWKRKENEEWINRFINCRIGEELAMGEINSDGLLDIVISGDWYEGAADVIRGRWEKHGYACWTPDAVVKLADMNKDGELDVVAAEMHQSPRKRVMIYLNMGEAVKWECQVIANTGSHNICVADIGNTGYLNIVGANWSGEYQPIEMWMQLPPKR